MAMQSGVLEVEEVSHGGGLNEGRDVFFDAGLTDGSEVRIVLPHTQVSAFLAKVMAFAGAAHGDRTQHGVGEDSHVEHTEMLPCQQIQIAPLADLTGVALQFHIQDGVSMVFPLQTKFLPPLSASLMKWHSGLTAGSENPS
jgi:hypothetical protein